MSRLIRIVPALCLLFIALSGWHEAIAAPQAETAARAPSHYKRVRLHELPENVRLTLALDELLRGLQTNPSDVEKLSLPPGVKTMIAAHLATEAQFEASARDSSQRALSDLCVSMKDADAVLLAHAIEAVDKRKEQRQIARFESLLASLSADDQKALMEFLSGFLRDGEISRMDVPALAVQSPSLVKEKMTEFCRRTNDSQQPSPAPPAPPIETIGPR